MFLGDRAKSKNKPSSTGVFHFVSRPEKQAGDQNGYVGRRDRSTTSI